jgi:hypothetical protein
MKMRYIHERFVINRPCYTRYIQAELRVAERYEILQPRAAMATFLSFEDHSHTSSMHLTFIQQGPEEQSQTESSIFTRILGNDVYRIAKKKLEIWLDVGDDQNDVGDRRLVQSTT